MALSAEVAPLVARP